MEANKHIPYLQKCILYTTNQYLEITIMPGQTGEGVETTGGLRVSYLVHASVSHVEQFRKMS